MQGYAVHRLCWHGIHKDNDTAIHRVVYMLIDSLFYKRLLVTLIQERRRHRWVLVITRKNTGQRPGVDKQSSADYFVTYRVGGPAGDV